MEFVRTLCLVWLTIWLFMTLMGWTSPSAGMANETCAKNGGVQQVTFEVVVCKDGKVVNP